MNNKENNIPAISVENVVKTYETEVEKVHVLRGISVDVAAGEVVSIMGPSGAGKSTLLHLIGALDTPTGGKIKINGKELQFNRINLEQFRCEKIGFIFQFHHLLPEFSALENVMMPAFIKNRKIDMKLQDRAKYLLSLVKLDHRTNHRPSELSGGELQRVAIARAFMNEPEVILADEPTGNLDQEHGEEVFDLMLNMNREFKNTFLIVTHNRTLSNKTHRILTLKGGLFVEDIVLPHGN